MERCDFSAVMRIILLYISSANALNQCDFVCKLFEVFDDENEDYDFDNGQVCRWFKGVKPVSPRIVQFYEDSENAEQLASSIEFQILPLMYDAPMAAHELYDLVLNDISISEQKRSELISNFNCDDNTTIANFISCVYAFR